MAAGHSIETALEKSKENLKNLEIANFYDKILSNIKVLGMTFENAVFDKKNGALRSYPSLLIRSIMTIVVQSAEKGLNAVTTSCITISKYLKGIHQVEFQINEIMSETTTSMKFLALFLAPLVAGITVAMGVIILNIMVLLSFKLGSIPGITIPTSSSWLLGIWKNGFNITPDSFQLVLGIYIIETTVLVSMFVNGIENGEDKIGEINLMGKTTFFATIIYTLTLFITYLIFGNTLSTLLLGV